MKFSISTENTPLDKEKERRKKTRKMGDEMGASNATLEVFEWRGLPFLWVIKSFAIRSTFSPTSLNIHTVTVDWLPIVSKRNLHGQLADKHMFELTQAVLLWL